MLVSNTHIFEKNLTILKEKDPLTAHLLEIANFNHIHLCQTMEGEANLAVTRFGLSRYYHNQNGAFKEALEIAENDILKHTEVVYFYGLGLGYIYDALQGWLKAKNEHHLILVEDDLEVFYYFLHTERATEALQNPQVTFFFYSENHSPSERLKRLIVGFTFQPMQFIALPSYLSWKEQECFKISSLRLFDNSWMKYINSEYLTGQSGFLKQFYLNLLELPDSYLSTGLYNRFKNIPAIICGAGPSLGKNIEFLKTLTDRALIFAGGSSLNIINAYNLIPHFGVGIDPNNEQFHRLATNDTFNIPFFYRNRMDNAAFKLMPGQKIYVPGSFNDIASWFEESLDITSPILDEGHNVVTFATEIVRNMGCNPIIFVGMDLALMQTKTYAPGIKTHPLWLGVSDPYSLNKEQLIQRKNIYNEDIITKWNWMSESNWLSRYAAEHPEIRMINATEGGIGFPGVPNISLAEIAQTSLTQTYDLKGRIQCEIQNSGVSFTRTRIFKLMNEYKTTLEKCIEYCSKIIHEQLAMNSKPDQTEQKRLSVYTDKSALYENLLQGEIGYQWFLGKLDSYYSYKNTAKYKKMNLGEQNEQLIHHYKFLESILIQHLDILVTSAQQFIHSSNPSLNATEAMPFNIINEQDIYTFQDGRLIVKDAELGLNIDKECVLHASTETHFDNSLKMETFYNSDGKLEGPSRFYEKNGKLVSESWFVDGLRQGKTKMYYNTGSLYCVQRYLNNLLNGKQEYFFKNGKPYVNFYYENEKLEGTVSIYGVAGNLLRQLHYQQGERHGSEKMWDSHGNCLMECEYEHGIPKGTVKQFNSSKQLIKEMFIREFPDNFDAAIWSGAGQVQQVFKEGIEDFNFFYEEKRRQVDFLEQAIKLVLNRIDLFVKDHLAEGKQEFPPEITQQLNEIRASTQHLDKLKAELLSIQEASVKASQEARHNKSEKNP